MRVSRVRNAAVPQVENLTHLRLGLLSRPPVILARLLCEFCLPYCVLQKGTDSTVYSSLTACDSPPRYCPISVFAVRLARRSAGDAWGGVGAVSGKAELSEFAVGLAGEAGVCTSLEPALSLRCIKPLQEAGVTWEPRWILGTSWILSYRRTLKKLVNIFSI